MKYLDVLVIISPARGGDFEVNVASDAGGEGNSILKLPFAMRDLSGVMFNVGGDARKFLAAEPTAAVPAGTASTFGVKLFEALFQGETREVLSRTESEAKRQPDTGVRIRLSMNLAAEGMAEVASLPWELMRRRDQSPLVVSVQTPVVRAFDTPKPIYLQPLSGKLRILALVSNPKGTAALNLKDEVARISNIWATLDNVEVDFVRPVEDEMLSHLAEKQYHVIHYMGHGDFDSGAGGLLMMERDDGSAHLISGDTFAAWLNDEPLRLVFLNACNTGTTGEHLGLHPFAGVASALIRSANVPSVVAMQFPISDKAAIIFAQTFYERIAQGFPVDAAVSDGRKRLLTSDGAEWATPVLYMRAVDGNLFDLAKPGVTPRKRVAAKASPADAAETPAEPAHAPAHIPAFEPGPPPASGGGRPQPLLDGGAAPRKAFYKNPKILGAIGAALVVLMIVVFGSGSNEATPPTEGGAVADAGDPEAAMASVPAAYWINDPDDTTVASMVLAKTTFARVRELADAGNERAAYVVGSALYYGMAGVPKSEALSARYFGIAAEKGLPVGQFSMGYLLGTGVAAETDADGNAIPGVVVDDVRARQLLHATIERGSANGWQALVDLYREITVIPDTSVPDPNNPATAAIAAINPQRWYDDQDYLATPPANVAQSVLEKATVDQVRALAEAGNAKANYVMGRIYREGLARQPANNGLAVPFFLAAARGGVPEAMFVLGELTATGVPAVDEAHPGLEKDALLSAAWFREAGERGNPTAAAM